MLTITLLIDKQMVLRIVGLFLCVLISCEGWSQEIVTTLNGFSLGQFREIPSNSLRGVLKKDRFEDGFEYEIHLVEPDTSVYMIFEFASHDLVTIWSAQLTGKKEGFPCGFKDLTLGMSAKNIKKLLGVPSEIESAGEYGEKWSYENTNYSLEITPMKTLGGIKIIDMSNDFYPNVLTERIPPPKVWMNLISSEDRKAVASVVSPGIEVYQGDSLYFFRNSMKEEIESDPSGVFTRIKEAYKVVSGIDVSDTLSYEENVRLALGVDPLHVVKARLDDRYVELVFKFMFGKYLIWEIRIVDVD
ncbi:MAG: hypothetical protein HN542_02195 [Flavobacteriales bacterium]|jgi:hypothetical protein|nr:hypothetical protein [Flavobacteriales bacterium]MBT4705399.1 hypothetical protein [Flavobacteriales bacterium]MBT5132224.1 hypothetical protein [Flavobacteriales bacterium]MBT5977430.1 hypothetical protein [Flavobacteriales bacterium]MBT6133059.1 hypothetical protein [Flavobacteriales bacterium]